MNQNQIQQLTVHLSQALDQNYDVVNMEAVLSVICTLEGTTITKEQLEATRLAKYINQLRRRTKNDQLARRAKSLLKKWREMVGIHQAASNDSQQPPPPTQFKQIIGSNTSELNIVDTEVNQNISQPYSSPLQRVITDLHSNIDSTETSHSSIQAGKTQQQQQKNHTNNFSSLLNHQINNVDKISGESPLVVVVSKPLKHQRTTMEPQIKSAATMINDHSSSNSVANKKFNDASIVIDIVSDSDENDSVSNSQQKSLATTPLSSSHQPFPVFYPRPTKKLKKDKKRKEREKSSLLFNITKEDSPQHSRSTNRTNLSHTLLQKGDRASKMYSADSEILSLSNSSMSSILSGDAISGGTPNNNRLRSTADNLTFAGRFKSVNQLDALSVDDNAVHINGQKTIRRKELNVSSSFEQQQPPSTRPIYDDYVNNDSSTSFSRLSPFEELEANQQQPQSRNFDESKHQVMLSLSQSQPPHDSKLEYQVPKKRGRKKGSKGVDSLIAKESSLSQQIFFGSSVKKVKTTKELFNDIQSRKPSISFRGDSLPAANKIPNANTLLNRESRSLLTRPTSSCSETSMHSPHTLETYLTNVSLMDTDKFSNSLEVAGNTDSDTITSEPSRDSMKSQRYKAIMNSPDSNSNSLQTTSAKHEAEEALTATTTNYNDVTTQLMHFLCSLKSPLSVIDAEKLYQSQIVPCTCTIVENIPNQPTDESEQNDTNNKVSDTSTIHLENVVQEKQHDNNESNLKVDNIIQEGSATPSLLTIQKPIKSIFDLDFDDDEDPLHSIIQNITPTKLCLKSNNNQNEDKNNANLLSTESQLNETDLKATSDNNSDTDPNPELAANSLLEPHPIYTVHEDINCIAKKRFDLQTNDVTSFHINALHNYYVPNINGNWNLIESSKDIAEILESYKVSDGADVVPKYGSLTYELIRKDLSYLKFARSFRKAKSFKSFLPTFLGVAKCLQTCRQATKRRLKLLNSIERFQDLKVISPSPLKVEIHHHHHNNNNNDDQVPIIYSDNNTTTLSYNLLKMVNKIDEDADDCQGEQTICRTTTTTMRRNSSSNSSNCSNSSLQLTQNSINEKLRNQRTLKSASDQLERNIVERNRKKRRKTMTASKASYDSFNLIDKKQRIKRIKIAINGNIASERQLPDINDDDDDDKNEESNNDRDMEAQCDLSNESIEYDIYHRHHSASDEDENEHESFRSQSTTTIDEDGLMENEYDYSNDEYAVVQRPMLGDSSNNHIVLTIKKTPSKMNSPVNSISPIVNTSTCVAEIEENTTETSKTNNNNPSKNILNNTEPNIIGELYSLEPKTDNCSIKLRTNTCLNSFNRCYLYRRRHRNRYQNRRFFDPNSLNESIDITLKHLFNNVRQGNNTQPAKTHRKIFFSNELNREDSIGQKERIVNYSSDEESEMEGEGVKENDFSSSEENKQSNYTKLRNETDQSVSVMNNDHQQQQEDDDDEVTSVSSNDDDARSDKDEPILDTQNELILNNNGMLPTFNAIYTNQKCSSLKQQSNQTCCNLNEGKSEITENCDRFVFNQRNNELSSSEPMEPAIENRTGIRAIMDNVALNNTTRIQEFKEWHQVLQLQSYNDEPLIVLPYVVLE